MTSRKLLTKIYDLNIAENNLSKKKKNPKDVILFRNKIKPKNKNNKKSSIEINKTEKGINNSNSNNNNIINNTNKLKLDNTNKTIDINKFPLIPKLNIKNIKIQNDEIISAESKNQKDNILLDYKLIESSSEDSKHPLKELKNGFNNSGWISERFSQYPQYIYIQFPKPVFIKRLEIYIHEKNIPSIIRFYSYYSEEMKNISMINYKQAKYNLVGFIKTNNNEINNFTSNEFRKIYINAKSLFFKIEFDKNYINEYNLFNQVGINQLDFFGEYLDFIDDTKNNNENNIKNNFKINFEDDFDLKGICDEQFKELKRLMKYNIEIENYMECKEIKFRIEKMRILGKKIFELESEKKIALDNEDYSKALNIKNVIDKMKIDILNISNLNIGRITDNKLILSERYKSLEQKYLKILEPVTIGTPLSPKNNKINIIYKYGKKYPLKNYKSANLYPSNDNFVSHEETFLPTVIKKYNPESPINHCITSNEEINNIENKELDDIPQELLEEYNDIINTLGEENMKKIFSNEIIFKEEGLNILLNKIGEIIQNYENDYNIIISSIFNLCLKLLDESHPSLIIKVFEVITKLLNYLENNKMKVNLEKNITNEIVLKIKKKLGDINIKVRLKASLLYSFLLSLNFCEFDNLIEELINDNNDINNSSINLILVKLDILANILNNFEESVGKKLNENNNNKFPSELVFDYLVNNLNNNNFEVRKKTRYCIKLFFDIYDIEKFKNSLDKINEREIKELINDIPKLQNYFSNNITINTKNNNVNKRVSKIKLKTNKINKKVILKNNINSKHFFIKENEQMKQQ